MHYEAVHRTSGVRMVIEVTEGIVQRAESPERPCFDPTFLGAPWSETRESLEKQGFTVTTGA